MVAIKHMVNRLSKTASDSASRATKQMRLRLTVAAACAGCLSVSLALAQTGAQSSAEPRTIATLRFGAGHSDNVFRRSTGQEESGSYSALGILVDIARDTERLVATVASDIELRRYATNGVEDEPYGDLDARVEMFAVPERFSWVIADQYGQGRVDPFSAVGPNNQEQINIFSTGPALYLPVGERTEVRMSSLAGQRTYEESLGFDSDTLETTFGVFRQMSTTTEIGVNLSARDVEYDDPQLDNTIDRAYFSYRKLLANGEASFQIGANGVDLSTRSDTYPYLDLTWGRNISARTSVAVDLQNSLIDASDSFRGGQDIGDQILRTTDVYERSSGRAALTLDAGRSQFVVGVGLGKDRYESDSTLDNDVLQLGFAFDRTISERLSAGVDIAIMDRKFQTVIQKDEDLQASLWVERSFGQQLSLNVNYRHDQRDGSNTAPYDENSIRLEVHYNMNPTTGEAR